MALLETLILVEVNVPVGQDNLLQNPAWFEERRTEHRLSMFPGSRARFPLLSDVFSGSPIWFGTGRYTADSRGPRNH